MAHGRDIYNKNIYGTWVGALKYIWQVDSHITIYIYYFGQYIYIFLWHAEFGRPRYIYSLYILQTLGLAIESYFLLLEKNKNPSLRLVWFSAKRNWEKRLFLFR